jgi:hypothetical protein
MLWDMRYDDYDDYDINSHNNIHDHKRFIVCKNDEKQENYGMFEAIKSQSLDL